jgi:hypothetical protein
MLSYFLVIALVVALRPGIAPRLPRADWRSRLAALGRIVDMGVLVVIVTGGIALGWVTPSGPRQWAPLAHSSCACAAPANRATVHHALRDVEDQRPDLPGDRGR